MYFSCNCKRRTEPKVKGSLRGRVAANTDATQPTSVGSPAFPRLEEVDHRSIYRLACVPVP